ncbi:MAG: type I-E CRISPR-associated protein Cas7/Cse4/CasC [Flexilinea sp.]
MFIELHLIQNFAPSNLNRDDTNNPKDCEFGGVRRARISSQCLKRAIRMDPCFERYTEIPTSKRTLRIASELSEELNEGRIDLVRSSGNSRGIRQELQQQKSSNR